MALVMGAWYFGTEFFRADFGADSGAIFNGRPNEYQRRPAAAVTGSQVKPAIAQITAVRSDNIGRQQTIRTETFDGLEWEIIGSVTTRPAAGTIRNSPGFLQSYSNPKR